jgi:predicted RNA-binding protein with RPS1 domain
VGYSLIDPLNPLKDFLYKQYPFLVMPNEVINVEFPRFYGVFDEPGVIGTFAGIMLFAERYNLKKISNIILFVSGVFSFSLFFILLSAVIGPGGKIIQGIQAESGATVSIEEVDGGGRIEIAGTNKAAIDCAMDKIKGIVSLPEIGEVYPSKVKSIMAYGAFVEFMPGKEGLLHISEIDWQRFDTMEQTGLKEGDKIDVKLLEVDQKTGKFKLSAKVLKEKPEGYVEPERRPRPERGERDERRPRPDRGERPERKDFRDPENRNDLV